MILHEIESRLLTIAYCDAAEPWQLGFQDPATPIMQGIIDLHHDIFFFLILISVFVIWMLVRALWHFHEKTNPIPQRIVHGTTIEIIWTIFPSIILMFIAIPSFALLYSMDEVVVDPAVTIKAIGHQWYWTYEYSDYNSSDEQSLTFDSYMIPEDDLELGQLRLLEVDNGVVVPGRLNQTSILVQRDGVSYGPCSEICGTNHAFMPIVVEAVSLQDYGSWVARGLLQSFFIVAHCDSSEDSLESTGRSQQPAPEAAVVPLAPPAHLNMLAEQLRTGLRSEILELLCQRVEGHLREAGVLAMHQTQGLQVYGDEEGLLRQRAFEVLVSAELTDETNLYDLEDLVTKLRVDQGWEDLDSLIKQTLFPRPPLG